MSLENLADIVRLSANVVRVLGQNPSPFTLQGTNTYLVGPEHAKTCILVDTGEGKDTYVPLLRTALDGRSISDIILTHWHHDHVDGIPSVLELLTELGHAAPRIHQFPSENALEGIVALRDGQEMDLGDELTLTVLHVPGHTTDSIALHLNTFSGEEVVFTADTVLGQGTAVFENLSSYMASLKRLASLLSTPGTPDRVELYPGHGPVIEKGREKVEEYIEHRAERERQVLRALEGAPSNGYSAEDLVDPIYGDLAPSVRLVAIRGLQLILDKLLEDGAVQELGHKHYVLTRKKTNKM